MLNPSSGTRGGARSAAWSASRAALLAMFALLTSFALGGCHADVATGTADNAIYNASYVGAGTIERSPIGYASAASQPTVVTLTLSTLGADFSGNLSSAIKTGLVTYAGGVAGRVTPAGGDFTYVQSTCQGTLHGSFVLNDGGTISGSAVGRDCDAGATGNNVRISFTNLVRQ